MEETEPLSIKSLSDAVKELEAARKTTLDRYALYRKAKELEDSLRLQVHIDLARFGKEPIKEEGEQ